MIGVIFDCDGVLVDSEKLSCGAWLPVLARRGLRVELAEIETLIGKSDAAVLEYLQRTYQVTLDAAVIAEREKEYFDSARGRLRSFAGVREALVELRAREYGVAVASSGRREKILFSLVEAALSPFFDVVCSATEVRHGKPAPDLFLLAARRLGLAPARCAVIEDSIFGIAAAKAAGMQAIGFTSSHGAAVLQRAGADIVIEDYGALLPGLLRCLK
jgi:HAD superfamily hydrolase (TIGR01509 family)